MCIHNINNERAVKILPTYTREVLVHIRSICKRRVMSPIINSKYCIYTITAVFTMEHDYRQVAYQIAVPQKIKWNDSGVSHIQD